MLWKHVWRYSVLVGKVKDSTDQGGIKVKKLIRNTQCAQGESSGQSCALVKTYMRRTETGRSDESGIKSENSL
jgi:hypothetical protein